MLWLGLVLIMQVYRHLLVFASGQSFRRGGHLCGWRRVHRLQGGGFSNAASGKSCSHVTGLGFMGFSVEGSGICYSATLNAAPPAQAVDSAQRTGASSSHGGCLRGCLRLHRFQGVFAQHSIGPTLPS